MKQKDMKDRMIPVALAVVMSLALFVSCMSTTPPDAGNGDGLQRSTPEYQGVATEGILRFLEVAEEKGLEMHSFMLLRHGKVVSEVWWSPYKRDIPHIMHSMSKTATATAIGFAVQEGLLSVDDAVISFFPEELPDTISPYLQQLTVKHLLTMGVGVASPPALTRDNPNWVRTLLATPITHAPGSRFLYDSNASFLLSAIVQKVTGETTFRYLTPRLFEPLGIRDIQWESAPDGTTVGGSGLRLKTVDMAKIGQFLLQKGMWEGKQLLPASWVEEAGSPQIYQQPQRTAEENAHDEGAQGYGYQVWICTHDTYRADGARGQLIMIMPEKDAVIVTTANVSSSHDLFGLMWEYIYPVLLPEKQKRDEMTAEMYGNLVSGLELARPWLTPDELSPRKNLTQSFRIEPNTLGIDQLTFDYLSDGDCRMTLHKGDESYDYLFGWDRWLYGQTDRPGPYYFNNRRSSEGLAPFTVCGYGSWNSTDDLSLCLLYMTEIQREYYNCRFAGEGVTVRVANTAQSNAEAVVLQGTLIH